MVVKSTPILKSFVVLEDWGERYRKNLGFEGKPSIRPGCIFPHSTFFRLMSFCPLLKSSRLKVKIRTMIDEVVETHSVIWKALE